MIPSKLKTILGIGLMGMAILVMPFGEFKPNRVIKGTLLSAFDLFGVWLTGLILLVLLVMLILALRMKRKPSWLLGLTAMLLTVLPSLVLMALSSATLTIDGVNPAASRISLGLGFYVLMVGILVLLSQFKAFRWILLSMGLLIGLTLVFHQIPNLGLVKELNNVQDKMAQAIVKVVSHTGFMGDQRHRVCTGLHRTDLILPFAHCRQCLCRFSASR